LRHILAERNLCSSICVREITGETSTYVHYTLLAVATDTDDPCRQAAIHPCGWRAPVRVLSLRATLRACLTHPRRATPVDNLQRAWRKVTDRAGLGKIRFHALRHSAATIALAQGVPLEVISQQLGHAGYAITADVYAHVGHDAHREAADAMEAALHT
jgi:integrase